MPYKYNSRGKGTGVGHCKSCKNRLKLVNGYCKRCRKFQEHKNDETEPSNQKQLSKSEKLEKRKQRMEEGNLSGTPNSVSANITRDNVNFDADKADLEDRQMDRTPDAPDEVKAEGWMKEQEQKIKNLRRKAQEEGLDVPDKVFQ